MEKAKVDETEGRTYKGEVVSLDKNAPAKLKNRFVQRLGKNTPPRDYEGYGKIPHFMYVKEVTAVRNGIWQLYISDPRSKWTDRWVYVDEKEHKLNILTGRMGVQLTQELVEYQRQNLGRFINYPGGNIGCDPEVFVVDKDGMVIPAWEFLPDKKAPAISGEWHAKGVNTLYWDGFQAEYTTPDYGCLGHESDVIQSGLYGILREARKKFPKAKLSIDSVLPVNPDILSTAEERYVEFGCMPSKNAYGIGGQIPSGRETAMRFAGGHLHFGIAHRIKQKDDELRVVKSLDRILGITMTAMFQGYENPMRRRYYGLPGEYRTPPHGLEYRVLPNAWLVHPVIMNVTFELARKVIGYGLQPTDHWVSNDEEVIEVITNSDVDLAKAILKRNEAVFKGLFNFTVFVGYTDQLFNLAYNGMGEYLQEPRDIHANWGLELGERDWMLHCEGPGMNWTKGKVLLADGKKLPTYKRR